MSLRAEFGFRLFSAGTEVDYPTSSQVAVCYHLHSKVTEFGLLQYTLLSVFVHQPCSDAEFVRRMSSSMMGFKQRQYI